MWSSIAILVTIDHSVMLPLGSKDVGEDVDEAAAGECVQCGYGMCSKTMTNMMSWTMTTTTTATTTTIPHCPEQYLSGRCLCS